MNKFLAVVKREYVQRVRARMFIVTTLLLPLVMALFGLVPAIILGIDAGSRMRVAVVDHTGKMYGHLNQALVSNDSDEAATANENANDRQGFRAPRGFGNFVLEELNPGTQST